MLGKYYVLLYLITNSLNCLRAHTPERKYLRAEKTQTLLAENITAVSQYPLFKVLRKAEKISKCERLPPLPWIPTHTVVIPSLS